MVNPLNSPRHSSGTHHGRHKTSRRGGGVSGSNSNNGVGDDSSHYQRDHHGNRISHSGLPSHGMSPTSPPPASPTAVAVLLGRPYANGNGNGASAGRPPMGRNRFGFLMLLVK